MTAEADRIKKLLSDPDLANAFVALREYYRDKIEETPVSDATALLDIRKMLYLLGQVEDHLKHAVQHGNLQDARLYAKENLWEKVTPWKIRQGRRLTKI